MVNVTVTMIDDPLRDLALSYAPAGRRPAIDALFALDAALGRVLRTTREPMVGQMRLAWWRDALQGLDHAPPPGEPVLQALAANLLHLGVTGSELATMIDGWEPLLGEPVRQAVEDHGTFRGGVLFRLAGRALGGEAGPLTLAGYGWALADLADNLDDVALAGLARDEARAAIEKVSRRYWPRAERALGAMVLIAERRLTGRVGATFIPRLVRLRLTGL